MPEAQHCDNICKLHSGIEARLKNLEDFMGDVKKIGIAILVASFTQLLILIFKLLP